MDAGDGPSPRSEAQVTDIEGEWDEVMDVVKRVVEAAGEGAPRVGLVLEADIRPGYEGRLGATVERVEQRRKGGA
ncbi:thiamine-binding protein [Prauserella flavalba]|uniref:thiamine-binding protein n=1 Tax=Prauserella flavalba TaxID=1477506 RepID=UPI001FE4D1BE|nr:thiamine-binding protein [Prauserella flavalba]